MIDIKNPYVGPRAFEPGETLYGRERELHQLESLLIAERLVLLHSPSGAGKTSLIQAGLVPSLREQDFNVPPVIRVNLEPPVELVGLAGFNRYTFSALASLEEGQPLEARMPYAELAALGLDAYLDRHFSAENDLALVFDQFEEILTTSPADREAKQAFFNDLGLALRKEERWGLFSMREDYLGALAPYLRPIPGQFKNRYRLDLLGPDSAKDAIQKPAQSTGVEFDDETAHKLLDDLRIIQVQQPDGSFERVPGQNIEPVQLQVVCYNLWQSGAADDGRITLDDLQKVGSVDEALAAYYAESIQTAARESGIDERAIRGWFSEQLITPDGIRSQALRGHESTAGLPNRVLGQLENAHLIRGETRAGKTWYELAHDRLVEPVRKSNTAWFDANLSLLQKQAKLWMEQGRGEGLLLRGKELDDADKEAKSLRLTDYEKEFLEACQVLRKREQIERRRNIALTILAISTTIAMFVAGFFYLQAQDSVIQANNSAATAQASAFEALIEKAKADSLLRDAISAKARANELADDAAQQARISRARELSTLSIGQGDSWPQRRLLLALEAVKILKLDDPDVPEVESALRNAVTRVHPNTPIFSEFGPVYALALQGNRYFAAGGKDGSVSMWDLNNLSDPPMRFMGAVSTIRALGFSGDGAWLAAGGDNGRIYLWDIKNGSKPVGTVQTPTQPVRALALSLDGKTLVSGGIDQNLYIWATETLTSPPLVFPGKQESKETYEPPYRHNDSISYIKFLSNSKFWSVSNDDRILQWDVKSPEYYKVNGGDNVYNNFSKLSLQSSFLGKTITTIGYSNINSSPMRFIGTDEGLIMMLFAPGYRVVNGTWGWYEMSKTLVGHEHAVNSITVSDDNSLIVSGGDEGIIRVWHVQSTKQELVQFGPTVVISNDVNNIFSLSFDQSGSQLLVSGGHSSPNFTGNANIWNLSSMKPEPVIIPISDYNPFVTYGLISKDGKWLAQSADYNSEGDKSISNSPKVVTLLNLQQEKAKPLVLSNDSSVGMAFSPDNRWFAYQDGKDIILYDLSDGKTFQKLSAHQTKLISLTFSPDSRWLVSADWNSLVLLWNLSTPNINAGQLGRFGYPFYSLSFSPTGKYLGAGDTWGNLLVWDFNNLLRGQLEPARLIEPACEGSLTSIDFSMNERLVAQSCQEIVIFRALNNTYAIQSIIDTNQGLIYQVKFSPDGNYLAVGGQSNLVTLFPISHKLLENAVCLLARRNLTRQEWEQFFPGEPYHITCQVWPPELESTTSPTP